MMKRLLLTTMAGIFAAGMTMAAVTSDAVIADLQAQGFTRVEVKMGPSQMKVEAIRGTEKVEVIYDIASGTVLKREVESVRPGENTAPGVSVRDRNRDFVRVVGGSDDDNDGSGRGRGRGGDDDDDDSDDDSDDDGSSGSDDDDDNSGSGSSGGGSSNDDDD